MIRKLAYAAGIAAAALAVGACETSKSSNPLSPTVAGPIPGVDITPPKVLEPPSGMKIAVEQQPITLLIENASSNGPRPLTYVFEIATDVNFTNKVFARDQVSPGDGGRTSVRLPDPLATGRTYFWRARAEDGANTGGNTPAASFDVFTPIVIQAPGLVAPGVNATVTGLRPDFVISNAPRSGPAGAITYLIEVADSDAFTNKIAAWTAAEGSGSQTTLKLASDLAYGKIYYWHVRAFDATTTGPWSNIHAFATPAEPPVVAPPGGGGGGGGGGATPAGFGLPSVTIVGGSPNVSSWPITSSITALRLGGGVFHINHTKRGQWPGVDIGGALQESTVWVIEQINGRWYATGAERMRPGQTDKALTRPSDIATGWFYSAHWAPMNGYVPRVGELVGFMIVAGSTRSDSNAPVRERSGVVFINWPGDGGGSYPPFASRE